MARRLVSVVALAALALSVGCRGEEEKEGKAAVMRYLDLLTKAYRASDADIVDSMLGDVQGLKVTGLIGVKRDMGLVLDSRLEDIQFLRVAREGQAIVVETRERWSYLDRRIGSGEPAGPESRDTYAMRYRFERKGGKLLLVDLAFLEQPSVGHEGPGYRLPVKMAHGLGDEPGQGAAPPADAAGRTGEVRP